MRVLVTGGTGVVGRATITALLQSGHVVHLLSRKAEQDAAQWEQGVHPVAANVTDAATLAGTADGCDAVLHLAGIVEEHGNQTFEKVNVGGTRNVVAEATRAGVRKFVYVSSLGSERGSSPYHESKRKAEAIVRQFPREWVILRPGNVYGPGDEQISTLMQMVRTLPVLPVVGDGEQRFQPLWHEDLADAIVAAVERDDVVRMDLDIAGPEVTTPKDVVDRLSRLTGRDVQRVGVPQMLASLGARLASAVGIDVPVQESVLTMLSEGNVIEPGRQNHLLTLMRHDPTPLERGLRKLCDSQDEQLPEDGVGPLRRKRIWVDISGTTLTPEQLMDEVRSRFGTLMASFIDTCPEPDAENVLRDNATLTLALPMRGHIQVRVAESLPRVTTLMTLAGHPLAGAVRFLSEARGDDLRFEIQVFDRASSVLDLLMMRTVGELLQEQSWVELAENVVRAVKGTARDGVHRESESLDDAQADLIEEWLRNLAMERKREEAGV